MIAHALDSKPVTKPATLCHLKRFNPALKKGAQVNFSKAAAAQHVMSMQESLVEVYKVHGLHVGDKGASAPAPAPAPVSSASKVSTLTRSNVYTSNN